MDQSTRKESWKTPELRKKPGEDGRDTCIRRVGLQSDLGSQVGGRDLLLGPQEGRARCSAVALKCWYSGTPCSQRPQKRNVIIRENKEYDMHIYVHIT